MNCIIPFESKVKFNCPVKEVCSISLEHEITKNDAEVLGNFIVSGTYKEHELSVNTSDFKFTIPFNVELTNRIENESLEFSIDNFTYDIAGSEMTVKIDYIVSADDVREDIISEESQEDVLDLYRETEEGKKEDQVISLPVIEIEKEPKDMLDDKEEIKEELHEEVREEVNPEIVSGVETENDYMTYHVHVVKEAETLESIALTYKIAKEDLEKINDITEIVQNDKLIIPIINE
ncbi:MAG: LysM peptidoglycan-binding domain-containing protein [Firmicutes bacterium]|nr:LysM peptidoglycan-binding domain-containing protein [Bacillota bacterium]